MAEVVPLADLTQSTLEGSGVFDTLMRSMKTHLEAEYQKGRIRGPEYSTVYLGSLDSVLQTSLAFLLQRQKVALEAELMAQQVLVAQAEVLKANAQVQVALAEVDKVRLEVELLTLNKAKIPAEIAEIQAKTSLLNQQKLNAEVELTVLQAQKCKLDAEYDLIVSNTNKSGAETSLLTQKVTTERAQVSAVGVDGDSVIGKQKALYTAQASGFQRDAEQKAAQILVDTWKVRRSTDEGTPANPQNRLDDEAIGSAVQKLLSGVGA
jgi:hypothetical protein